MWDLSKKWQLNIEKALIAAEIKSVFFAKSMLCNVL